MILRDSNSAALNFNAGRLQLLWKRLFRPFFFVDNLQHRIKNLGEKDQRT